MHPTPIRTVPLRVFLSSVVSCAVVFGAAVSPVAAQRGGGDWTAPAWVGHVTFVGANALIGGLTAGVVQELRGGDFRDGFTRGALGGAVAYAGRRVAVERFDGAGLLGRQVSALGASIVRNAADGRPSFERLFLPIGPVNVYVERRDDGRRIRPKLNLVALVTASVIAAHDEAALDWGASLSAGTLVLTAPGRWIRHEDGPVAGMASDGIIVFAGWLDPEIFAHERVHVLQRDFFFNAWSEPVEGWLTGQWRPTATVYRYVDVGALFSVFRGLIVRAAGWQYADRPWEIEAAFLEGR